MNNDTHDGTAPATPGSAPLEPFDRLKNLLREMFQLDRGDLDFGLYRIMAMKAGEVEAFLDRDLLPQVKEVLAGVADEDRIALGEALAEAREQARQLGVDPDEAPKVRELRDELAKANTDADAEAAVYGHLATFFARYYREGDFMSLRRYAGGGRTTYLIPYDGEEVRLHWANADQYYIKTTENYAAYAFTAGEGETTHRVRFEIAAADAEKDNVKAATDKQRRFVLAQGGDAITHEGTDLVVRFEHRPLTDAEKKTWPGNGARQQERIDEASVARVLGALDGDWRALLAAPAPTEADSERTLLAKHVARYTAKNSFDYFIHKDLGGFLRRELDLYLKTEVLNLDDLAAGDADRLRRALARMLAVRHVAEKIVAFLAQLEDFQKRLWLKKKFVLETQWCVTLDRVPESLWPEIAANEAQRREWVDLFAIDEVAAAPSGGDAGDGKSLFESAPARYGDETDDSKPLSAAFLKANLHLVLDTRHFDGDFRDRLLEALSDAGPLDEQTHGLLIHGENFQALNLLQARYRGQVKCVYIDPPYNTDSSPIMYKNDLKDSSYLSLMEDRLRLAKSILMNNGILCCAIDDEEVNNLRILLSQIFDKEIGIAPVRSTPVGRTSRGKLSPTHEYALFYGGNGAVPGSLEKTEQQQRRYPYSDRFGRYAWRNLIRTGTNDLRADRPKQYYPIYVDPDNNLRIPKMSWQEDKQEYEILEPPREDEAIIWPVGKNNGTKIEKNWERGWERVQKEIEIPNEYRVRRTISDIGEEQIDIDFVQRMDPASVPKTWWGDAKYASSNYGAMVLKELFGESTFDFAKSVSLVTDCIRASAGGEEKTQVADFFAGSGTTGHAVINLNREDDGGRMYILVEMGDHFDTVMLPRLKKVAYSPDWKAGKPVTRDKGVSHLIRYVRLESYEDTLDGLVLTPPSSDLLATNDRGPIEDYRLRYALDTETASSSCLLGRDFLDPFACTLSVVRDSARRETPVDLPETFNFLLGLHVESRRRLDGVLAIAGKDAQGQQCLVLWRNLETLDNDALEAWFAEHRACLPDALDLVYVNGDHTLNAIRQPRETWTAETIEPLFRQLMLEVQER